MPRTLAAAALALLGLAAPAFAGEALADTVLKETGSTLILPLFQTWATDYPKTHPGVTITTAGTGSAQGVDQALSGTVQIGTSDAYMSDEQMRQRPDMLDIPLAISAQTIDYNLPDLQAPLKLDGPTLVAIYTGAIRSWDDKAIAAMNPGVALPHHDIVPVHRKEGSGDTFVFTQYLALSTERQNTSGDTFSQYVALPDTTRGDGIGTGTSVNWPDVPGALAAEGNQGIVDALGKTPYAIGYLGVSFEGAAQAAKLGTALVRSYSGQFLLPTPDTIGAAAASLGPRTPDDERLTLVNAPGENCYPLINYEYAIVTRKQPDAATAAAIRAFLLWAIAPDEANAKTLATEHFIPLPAHIWVKSQDQIQAIR